MTVETDSSVTARRDAISKALDGFDEFGADTSSPAAVEVEVAEAPAGDVQPDSASTSTASEPSDGGKPPVERPVEASTDPKPAEAVKFEAPKNWSEDRRKAFAQTPPEAQKLLLEVHKEANAGFTKYAQQMSEKVKEAEDFTQKTAPYQNDMRQAGMSPAQAFDFMAKERTEFNQMPGDFLSKRLSDDQAINLIKDLAQKKGLDASRIFGIQTQQASQEDPNLWVDPRVLQLESEFKQKLTPLEQQLSRITQFVQSEHQKQQQQERDRQTALETQRQRDQESLENDLSTIIGSADEAGNPKYPHFEQVEETLVEILGTKEFKAMANANPAEKFDRAYRKAIRLHDDLYEKETEARLATRLKAQETQKAVQKASAASTRKGSPGSNGAAAPGPMSRKDAINQALAGLQLS